MLLKLTPKAMYTLNSIPVRIPRIFSEKPRTNSSEICVKPQKTLNNQSSLRKWQYHAPYKDFACE